MCGYCIEHNSFGMIAGAQTEQFSDVASQYFCAIGCLQECPDIVSALTATTTDPATDGILSSIIACRGLEILMTLGFNSAAYQSLLNNPAYLSAIDAFTAEAAQKKPRPKDPRFDLSAASWTVDRRTYAEAGYMDAQLRQWSHRVAKSLIKQYVDFRLNGIGLHHNDLDERLKQIGVLDPLEDICAEDRQVFADHFPAFWCSLQWLGRHEEGVPDLWEVVTKYPIGVPEFEGLELWFQRRAALLTYDRFGFAPFLQNIPLVRGELFQYIGLMRPVSQAEHADLLNALNLLGATDHNGEHFSLRQWVERGDLQLL